MAAGERGMAISQYHELVTRKAFHLVIPQAHNRHKLVVHLLKEEP